MAASLLDSSLEETLVNGFVQYQRTETYQVIATATTQEEYTILADIGLPALGSPKLFGSVLMYCNHRSPRRVGVGPDRLKWIVTCTFSNETSTFERDYQGQPVFDLADVAPTVNFDFQEYDKEKTDAKFIEIIDVNGLQVTPPPYLVSGNRSIICNSAGDPTGTTSRAWNKVISYSKYFRDYNNAWDTTLVNGSTNDATVTLTQSDGNGVRLSQSYAAETLLLGDVQKQDIWRDSQLWFRTTFVLLYNPDTWIRKVPDKGFTRRVFTGQYKNTTTAYSAAEVTALTSRNSGPLLEFTSGVYGDSDDDLEERPSGYSTLSEARALNGYGNALHARNADTSAPVPCSLYWQEYDPVSFASLGIS